MSLLSRLLPEQADNRFGGLRPALWLLGLLIFVKLAMSLNSILNTARIAGGADGIPLASFGPAAARQVLLMFALLALCQLVLALIALVVLVRYRALVPFIYLVLLGEHLARRAIARGYAGPGAAMTDVAFYVNYGLLTLLALGLVLSLIPARPRAAAEHGGRQ
jgi:hypothetical protein